MTDTQESEVTIDVSRILNAVSIGEDSDWEFKAAKGGLPGSLWETYSAMANTDGGTIVLGVKQKDGRFSIEDLPNAAKLEQDFWNLANNRQKISHNLLNNSDVTISKVQDKPAVVIRIPRASRQQRPVFVGLNPLEGTYRRFNEGDYNAETSRFS